VFFAGLFQSIELAPTKRFLAFKCTPQKTRKKNSTLVGSFQLLTSPKVPWLVMEFEGEHWGQRTRGWDLCIDLQRSMHKSHPLVQCFVFWVNFVMHSKWQSSIGKFSRFWLRTTYESFKILNILLYYFWPPTWTMYGNLKKILDFKIKKKSDNQKSPKLHQINFF